MRPSVIWAERSPIPPMKMRAPIARVMPRSCNSITIKCKFPTRSYYTCSSTSTTLNRQGPDYGKQYRSVIFFHDAEQERTAQKVKDELDRAGRFPRKNVTQIVPATEFWRAEEYHQRYFEKHDIAACRTH